MERNQFEVFSAALSEKRGLPFSRPSPFDMVLCGDRLPDGTGLETSEELIRSNPETCLGPYDRSWR